MKYLSRYTQILTTTIILALSVSVSCHAQQHLRMGYVEFEPYYYTDSNGEVKGHLVDLGDRLAKHAGFTLEYQSYPVKRLAKYVVSGEVDIFFGMPTLTSFSEGALISSMAIDQIQLQAYTLSPMPPINKKEDLKGKRILILRGYSYGDWIHYIKDPKNNIDFRIADTHKQALRMLVRRDIDYLLDYKLPINHAARKLNLPDLHSNNIITFGPHMMVSKKTKNAKEVMEKLEAAFEELFPGGAAKTKGKFQIEE
ncbi:MAG: transporter substrate-binding domain-containing protein [Agarilytica sp.]